MDLVGPGKTTISVVIATYGEAMWRKTARMRALPSAINQIPFEVVLRHDYDGTLAEVRNGAAESAKGEWLCFLDADDELAPGYLHAMGKAARRKLLHDPTTGQRIEDGLLAPALQVVDRLGYDNPPRLPNRHEPMDVLNHCVIGTLVPRELFLRVGGFSDDYSLYEDWELFLRCVRAGATIVDVPHAIYRAYEREHSRNVGVGSREVYERIRSEHLAATR